MKELAASYRSNSEKEELINEYAENFRRQYVHLYRDRKPLLLSPLNEAGVQVRRGSELEKQHPPPPPPDKLVLIRMSL